MIYYVWPMLKFFFSNSYNYCNNSKNIFKNFHWLRLMFQSCDHCMVGNKSSYVPLKTLFLRLTELNTCHLRTFIHSSVVHFKSIYIVSVHDNTTMHLVNIRHASSKAALRIKESIRWLEFTNENVTSPTPTVCALLIVVYSVFGCV